MSMFGFDKIKAIAKDNLKRVVKTDFGLSRTPAEQKDDNSQDAYSELLVNQNHQSKESA